MLDAVPLLQAVNLHKTYRKHAVGIPVLRGLSLDVFEGEFLSIVGASGSGKSTLLHLLGTLDQPDEGGIYLNGQRINDPPSVGRENLRQRLFGFVGRSVARHQAQRRRDQLRNRTFGFIFQFYHLLPEFTTLENVLVPEMISQSVCGWVWRRGALRQRATELLERVGLGHRLKHTPRELSGGEMQRAAIARALINRPRILLADEPTGNLDADTGAEIVRLLRDLNQQSGLTIIMVTHNLDIVAETDRVVRLTAGQVEQPIADCRLPIAEETATASAL